MSNSYDSIITFKKYTKYLVFQYKIHSVSLRLYIIWTKSHDIHLLIKYKVLRYTFNVKHIGNY